MSAKPSRTTFRKRLDQMVRILRDDIITGKRKGGEFLPSETALGEQFQLSKNSVRKGLEMLVSESLIEKVARVGNRVREPEKDGMVTLRLGYYPSVADEAGLNQLVSDFHIRHPQIRVQTLPLPYDSYGTALTEYFRNGMLDVVTINTTNFLQFSEEEDLTLLEPVKPKPGVYGFLNGPFAKDGIQYVQPFMFSPVVLCYNRDHFAEKGLDEPDSSWTWDDLMRHALLLRQGTERFGFHFHLFSAHRWPIFLLQTGAAFERGSDGRVRVWGTPLTEGLETCRDLVYSEGMVPVSFSESDADGEELFLQEKVSMIMTTYFGLGRLTEAGFSFDVAPLPHGRSAKTLLIGIGLAVNAQSPLKEAAGVLVDFLVSQDAQMSVRQQTLSIPALKKAAEWKEREPRRLTRYHLYREIVPTFASVLDLQLTSRQLAELHRELKSYWSRMEELDDVCRRLEETL